ncbi:DUF2771 domain-containing protein [Corynebacterium guaraldiae]|uniref:DUF2771 domain-containing protein n=2 Tax=Corynebacterium TaxID=1716 RepID=A0ABT0TCR8_9CORY|nr:MULTISPECIES: DUF2771 domain-containing protein [Corynebacterium]MCL8494873.1 DUF2771 domain-containing protein [Corynebacterium intestinale]MCP1391109.1 DUF2771 domain-containing protein [Corynebacterium intestinale]MDK8898874.1 DUF2771 domain-containing protein [Corynebacterium sp. MSK004]OFK90972.1 hypothetical protein HMPREF2792_05400 [Corynebacterium sp. HMSC068H04]TRX34693.1 DUF2771 domain-containing protein [Corynebacterium guaraldiae]
MATVKQARKKSLLQFLALIIAVAVIVVAVVLFQKWRNDRPGPEPQDVTITATVGSDTLDVAPYSVCEPGTDCKEGEVPNLTVGPDDTLKLEIPEAISNHEWSVLSIYDDPAANDSTSHGANETTSLDIPGSVPPIEASTGERPKLMVVEISTLMIGHDANGEETPMQTVWSLSTMTDEELKESKATGEAPAEK